MILIILIILIIIVVVVVVVVVVVISPTSPFLRSFEFHLISSQSDSSHLPMSFAAYLHL